MAADRRDLTRAASRSPLHLPELTDISTADWNHVSMVLEVDLRAPQHVALEFLDGAQVDDDATVNLRELMRVQTRLELLERHSDQVSLRCRDYLGVLVARLKIQSLV